MLNRDQIETHIKTYIKATGLSLGDIALNDFTERIFEIGFDDLQELQEIATYYWLQKEVVEFDFTPVNRSYLAWQIFQWLDIFSRNQFNEKNLRALQEQYEHEISLRSWIWRGEAETQIQDFIKSVKKDISAVEIGSETGKFLQAKLTFLEILLQTIYNSY